jgi:hypothetical protein
VINRHAVEGLRKFNGGQKFVHAQGVTEIMLIEYCIKCIYITNYTLVASEIVLTNHTDSCKGK